VTTTTARAPQVLPSRRTVDDFIASRSGGFDVLRLVLAFLVLVSHTWPLGGFGREPGSPFGPRILTLGGFAVGAFFSLSGLLVGRSALRRTTGAFVRARAARVLPAYWTALALSAFVAGWLGWAYERRSLSGYLNLNPGGPVLYVVRNAMLPVEFFHASNGAFAATTPYGVATGQSWLNGSLWTLPYEIRCYAVVAIVALLAHRFGTRRTVTAAWLLAAAFAAGYQWRVEATDFIIGPIANAQLIAFILIFLSGTLVGVWSDRVRLFGIVPVIGLVVALVAGRRSAFYAEYVAGAATAVLVAPAAALLAPLAPLLRKVDISYGVYLYAWPIQQLVAMYDIAGSPWMFIVVSGALTVTVAIASWFVIEQPAMRRWSRR
jgi:peptidoglycan/LPS O-acetylase OafA/YrhL